jgi:uncharacterized protein YpmB
MPHVKVRKRNIRKMKSKMIKIVGILILLAVIGCALALRQSAETFNKNREDEAERGIFQLEK